jgi:hypothetical protein
MRLGVEGIENRNAGRLKIRYIPRYHNEAVFERRRCNCEIKLFVAKLCCKSTPIGAQSRPSEVKCVRRKSAR